MLENKIMEKLELLVDGVVFDEKTKEVTYTNQFLDAVNYFAQSELPNKWFLQHFCTPSTELFCEKKYWCGFAKILEKRGFPAINDCAKDILKWYQDQNWQGFYEAKVFVKNNKETFAELLKESLKEAYLNKDENWFICLLYEYTDGKRLSKTVEKKVNDFFNLPITNWEKAKQLLVAFNI